MEKITRSNSKIDADIRSAGQTFIGLRMADMLCRISLLENITNKNGLIQEYFNNQVGTYDKDAGGTRTRVNSVIRIIKADKVIYALEKIDGTNPLVLPEAADKAKETINKIHNGKIKLPTSR